MADEKAANGGSTGSSTATGRGSSPEMKNRKRKHRQGSNDSLASSSDNELTGDSGPASNTPSSTKTLRSYLKHPAVRRARFIWKTAFLLVVLLSLATRLWKIHEPAEVVFDEVHFGKFASFYLRGTYYFDVHPPLGKLILAATGWFHGYDGHYLFDKIGESYYEKNVPFVGLRLTPAFFGAMVPPLVFLILKESGIGIIGCTLAALMCIFDNSLVAQSRLILLDSMLLFFCIASIYCWIRFYRLRYEEFSVKWWTWLCATGTCLACATGVKMVGLFTVAAVGVATLYDLWRLLDWRRGLPMRKFIRHFAARALGLIILPFLLYLSFFYIHFALLYKTGPGDDFMSPAFQATLVGNEMHKTSLPVPYNANITLKHRSSSVYLHSHKDKYPLKYEDGRISSQGNQVTGYPHKDANNIWAIRPVDCELYPAAQVQCDRIKEQMEAEGENGVVRVQNGDYIRLEHVLTKAVLLTHDVASSLTPTHMEMTTYSLSKDNSRYNETLWRVEFLKGAATAKLRSKSVYFKIINAEHGVAVHSSGGILPDWAYGQQEINGNKNLNEGANSWLVETVEHASIDSERINKEEEQRKNETPKLSFMAKFLELQILMLRHNSGLTKPHPFQSGPGSWPFVIRGISFWEDKNSGKQIYLLGNPFIWWFCIVTLLTFVAMWIIDRIVLRRGLDDFGPKVRLWWDRNTGFLFLTWVLHYFPFFLMGRSLFLHHYFPALVCSIMVSASVVEFIARMLGEGIGAEGPEMVGLRDFGIAASRDPITGKPSRIQTQQLNYPHVPPNRGFWMEFGWGVYPRYLRDTYTARFGKFYFTFVVVLVSIFVGCFWYFSPLTYGTGFSIPEGSTVKDEVNRRKWVSEWDFQFA